ncbi:hypothetical protein CRG98_005358 [Punica granatum]|uniref:Uncharacterized protein n=1 Tax=Punica granatum TaxID=22663 RepID=A0A2I0L0I6_PUNGR|nr:hypothetical protein CRG98_005358 [Punica granatum]
MVAKLVLSKGKKMPWVPLGSATIRETTLNRGKRPPLTRDWSRGSRPLPLEDGREFT